MAVRPPYRKLTLAEAFDKGTIPNALGSLRQAGEQRGGFTGVAAAADPSWCFVKRLRGLETLLCVPGRLDLSCTKRFGGSKRSKFERLGEAEALGDSIYRILRVLEALRG